MLFPHVLRVGGGTSSFAVARRSSCLLSRCVTAASSHTAAASTTTTKAASPAAATTTVTSTTAVMRVTAPIRRMASTSAPAEHRVSLPPLIARTPLVRQVGQRHAVATEHFASFPAWLRKEHTLRGIVPPITGRNSGGRKHDNAASHVKSMNLHSPCVHFSHRAVLGHVLRPTLSSLSPLSSSVLLRRTYARSPSARHRLTLASKKLTIPGLDRHLWDDALLVATWQREAGPALKLIDAVIAEQNACIRSSSAGEESPAGVVSTREGSPSPPTSFNAAPSWSTPPPPSPTANRVTQSGITDPSIVTSLYSKLIFKLTVPQHVRGSIEGTPRHAPRRTMLEDRHILVDSVKELQAHMRKHTPLSLDNFYTLLIPTLTQVYQRRRKTVCPVLQYAMTLFREFETTQLTPEQSARINDDRTQRLAKASAWTAADSHFDTLCRSFQDDFERERWLVYDTDKTERRRAENNAAAASKRENRVRMCPGWNRNMVDIYSTVFSQFLLRKNFTAAEDVLYSMRSLGLSFDPARYVQLICHPMFGSVHSVESLFLLVHKQNAPYTVTSMKCLGTSYLTSNELDKAAHMFVLATKFEELEEVKAYLAAGSESATRVPQHALPQPSVSRDQVSESPPSPLQLYTVDDMASPDLLRMLLLCAEKYKLDSMARFEGVLKERMATDHSMNMVQVHTVILEALCPLARRGLYRECTSLFELLRVPTVSHYNFLIKAFVRGGQSHQALEMFENMRRHGVHKNIRSYMLLMRAHALLNNLGKVRSVYFRAQRHMQMDMSGSGFHSKSTTGGGSFFSSALFALDLSGANIEELHFVISHARAKNCAAATHYRQLMDACTRRRLYDEALAVPDLMQEHGIAMTIALYVRVMDLHRTIGDLPAVELTWHQMMGDDIEPSETAYLSLMSSYVELKKGDVHSVEKIFRLMKGDGHDSPAEAYYWLMRAHMHAEQYDQVLKVFNEVQGQPLERSVWVSIHAHLRRGEYADAMGVMDQHESRLTAVNAVADTVADADADTFQSFGYGNHNRSSLVGVDLAGLEEIIDTLGPVDGNEDGGPRLRLLGRLKEFHAQEYKLVQRQQHLQERREATQSEDEEIHISGDDSEGASLPLPALEEEHQQQWQQQERQSLQARDGLFSNGSGAIEDFEQEGDVPRTYQEYIYAIRGYGRAHRLDMAFATFEDMPDMGFQPDLPAYTSLAWAYAHNGEVNSAELVLQEMESLGMKPTIVSFNIMFLAYARITRASSSPSFLEWNPAQVVSRYKHMQVSGVAPSSWTRSLAMRCLLALNDQKSMQLAGQIVSELQPDAAAHRKNHDRAVAVIDSFKGVAPLVSAEQSALVEGHLELEQVLLWYAAHHGDATMAKGSLLRLKDLLPCVPILRVAAEKRQARMKKGDSEDDDGAHLYGGASGDGEDRSESEGHYEWNSDAGGFEEWDEECEKLLSLASSPSSSLTEWVNPVLKRLAMPRDVSC